MTTYGGIQTKELTYWLNALINASHDRRKPLNNVHGGTCRARTARQDLLNIADCFRQNVVSDEDTAEALGQWCAQYLEEDEWYQLPSPSRGERSVKDDNVATFSKAV